MAWKIIRNDDSASRKEEYVGKCPKYGENATVTIHYTGIMACKTDLQKTYNRAGSKCSLLKNYSGCLENCPLLPKRNE